MNYRLFLSLLLSCPLLLTAQKTDTLTFYSEAFQQNRTVYVKTPEFYIYQSDEVNLPVIFILDGQHEWFANPLVSTITYLQYTHEIPQAITVIIPLINRNSECGIISLEDKHLLPLHRFITEDLKAQLETYHPNEYKLLIGHSFSASFALYSFLKSPEFYSAIISNSPYDSFEEIIIALQEIKQIDSGKISLAIGGLAKDKDYHHRVKYDRLKSKYPSFFNSIQLYEANQCRHNSVPLVANPFFLTSIFSSFSSRFAAIAVVDDEYLLVEQPEPIDREMAKIKAASKLGAFFYPPEVAELNGIASRYLNSDLNDYGIALYEMAVLYYPKFYEFHLSLYELLQSDNPDKAKWHLTHAYELLQTLEPDSPEKEALMEEIGKSY